MTEKEENLNKQVEEAARRVVEARADVVEAKKKLEAAQAGVLNGETDPSQFSSLVKAAGDRLVVIDFSAEWCGPCHMIKPVVASLSKEHTNTVFLEVDVDSQQDIAAEYDVTAMPTFVFLQKGHELGRFSGADPKKLGNALKKYESQPSTEPTEGHTIGGGEKAGVPSAEAVTGSMRKVRAVSIIDATEPGNGGDTTISVRLADGSMVTGDFPSDTRVSTLYSWTHRQTGVSLGCFSLAILAPRKILGEQELDMTLKEVDLCPRSVLAMIRIA